MLSSHQWRNRFYIVQGKLGGLLIYVDDPELEHFSAVEMNADKFPNEVILTHRSIASPPWKDSYEGNKWVIVKYDGDVSRGAAITRRI